MHGHRRGQKRLLVHEAAFWGAGTPPRVSCWHKGKQGPRGPWHHLGHRPPQLLLGLTQSCSPWQHPGKWRAAPHTPWLTLGCRRALRQRHPNLTDQRQLREVRALQGDSSQRARPWPGGVEASTTSRPHRTGLEEPQEEGQPQEKKEQTKKELGFSEKSTRGTDWAGAITCKCLPHPC